MNSPGVTARILVSSDPDLDAVVATLTDAFAADPIIEWAIPVGTPDRVRYLDAFFEITTRDILDRGGVVASSADYSGVLVWSPADETIPTDEDAEYLLDEVEEATGPSGARARILLELLDERHPDGLPPHCHVMFAAAREHVRGSGVREAIASAFNERRAAEGSGVYAEASSRRSLALWERLGLSRVGSEIVLPDGPSLFPIFIGPVSG